MAMIHTNRGFTIFFAMLVGGLALSIGLAIYDLTVRELELSATANQSQYSIYSADMGVECALHWDYKYGGDGTAFATSSASAPTSNILCNGQSIPTTPAITTSNAATTSFTVTVSAPPQTYCASVSVGKYTDLSGVLYTYIVSRGYNTSCPPAQTQIGRVERTLQVSY